MYTSYIACKQNENSDRFSDMDSPSECCSSDDEYFSTISTISMSGKDSVNRVSLPTNNLLSQVSISPLESNTQVYRVSMSSDPVSQVSEPTKDSLKQVSRPKKDFETRISIPINDLETRVLTPNLLPTTNSVPIIGSVNQESFIPKNKSSPTPESRKATTKKSFKRQIIPIIITENDRHIKDNESDTDDDFSFDEVFVADDIESNDVGKRHRQNSDNYNDTCSVDFVNTTKLTEDNHNHSNAGILTSILTTSSGDSDTSSVFSESSINLAKFRRRLREKSNKLKGRPSSGSFVYNNTWENVGLPHKPTGVFFKDFDRPVTDDVSRVFYLNCCCHFNFLVPDND